jgi:hypothetical protein
MVRTETEACEKDERNYDRRDKANGISVDRKVVRSHPQVCHSLRMDEDEDGLIIFDTS